MSSSGFAARAQSAGDRPSNASSLGGVTLIRPLSSTAHPISQAFHLLRNRLRDVLVVGYEKEQERSDEKPVFRYMSALHSSSFLLLSLSSLDSI